MSMRIVPANFLDAEHCADLAVTSEASASFAVENLQSNVRDRAWRSTDLTSQVITGTFGGNARQISHLSIWPADGSSLIGATVAVRMWSDVAQTTLVRNVSAANFFTFTGDNYGEFLWGIQSWGVHNADRTARLAPFSTWFTPIAVSAFEITIASAGAVDTPYFEARRIVLGDYVQAPYNAAYGAAPQWKPGSSHRRTLGGSLRRISRRSWREMRFETILASEADRSAWADLMYVCDPSKEVVISLFPEHATPKVERDFTVMGSLEMLNPLVFENVDLHRLQLAIVES
ncbi:MAG: hypothetical protein IPM64_17450 [Phycisphaerales bacterium]|nr:hypothetical protein [Phycisphaerales bacterium]